MKSQTKRIVLAVLMTIVCASVFAQNSSRSTSATIQIVAIVPSILKLNLDFANSSTATLLGYLRSDGTTSPMPVSKGNQFEIKPNATVELGNARLFSNVPGSYTIIAYSANGGTLKNSYGMTADGIPYSLILGSMQATPQGGAFRFTASGKSTRDGTELKVALALGSVPANAPAGFYADQLMFSVSAN